MRDLRQGRYFAQLAGAAFVIGAVGLSPGPAKAGCQSGAVANNTATHLLTSKVCQSSAKAPYATAVGRSAFAWGTSSTALGESAFAQGDGQTSLGALAGGPAVDGATNVGTYSGRNGAGIYSTAVGAGAAGTIASQALGNYSVAIGGGIEAAPGARADSSRSVAIGNMALATGPAIISGEATAVGYGSKADGIRAVAIGSGSSSLAYGTSVGFNTITAIASIAMGTDAAASGDNSAAVGGGSTASGTSSLALGRKAVASKAQSVAIGNNSIANVANTVSVGRVGRERRIMNVAAGVKSTDAVNLSQVQALVASATGKSPATVAMLSMPAPPAVSVVSVGLLNSKPANDDMQRQLLELRSLVQQQHQRIAQLESRAVTAAK